MQQQSTITADTGQVEMEKTPPPSPLPAAEMGNCRLIHGDCLEVMAQLPDGSVNAIITDLPYGTTANKWDAVIPFAPMWESVARILTPRGVFITTASQPFTSRVVMSNPDWFKHEWVWIKNRGSNFANTVREPMKEHESVLVFSRGGWTYNKQMQKRTGGGTDLIGQVQKDKGGKTSNYGAFGGRDITLSELRVPSSWQKFNTETGLHPTQKPIGLYRYLVRTYTNPNDTIMDIAMGSGTTGVACIEEGRSFIGIEIDNRYYLAAKRRIFSALACPKQMTLMGEF